MHELIQDNMLAVMCCLFMLFFLAINNSFKAEVKQFFWKAIILILILILVDAWEEIEAIKSHPGYGRIAASVVGYSIRPTIGYLVCRASLKVKDIKFNFLFVLPLLINIIMVCTAFFTSIVFSYDSANQFVRGPLGYITFVTGIIYAIALCYISVQLVSKGNRGEARIVLFIMAILALSTIIESKYKFNAILSGGSALGLTFYYLYLNINISEHDMLTGAKVRRNFYLDAERTLGRISAVISIDLNGLKALNDQYGHREGDRALVTLAEVVTKILPKEWQFYRTGGDEFMILCQKSNELRIKEFLQEFYRNMEDSDYSAAAGYAMYRKEMDFEKACHISDTMMYEKKRQMKESN